MNFEDEIKLNRLERINSLYYQLNKSNIEKSSFNNIEEVSGERIKKSIEIEIRERKDSINRIDKSLSDVIVKSQVQPNLDPSIYIPSQWEGRIESNHPMYSYSQMKTEKEINFMPKYNDLVKKRIQLSIENKKLDAISMSINKNKTYHLPQVYVDKFNF